jgi:hypothetical protein
MDPKILARTIDTGMISDEHVWPDFDEVLDQLQKSIRDAQDARKKFILFHVQSFEVTYLDSSQSNQVSIRIYAPK